MQSITAEKRDILGKKTKNLRKKGILPAVLYGKGESSESISVKESDFLKLWKTAGVSTVVALEVENKKKNVLIHDVAIDPLKDTPTHVDFYIVDMNKPITIDVALEFTGESDAVKAGGILVKVLHEVKIEALPKDLPHSLSVDISSEEELKAAEEASPALDAGAIEVVGKKPKDEGEEEAVAAETSKKVPKVKK